MTEEKDLWETFCKTEERSDLSHWGGYAEVFFSLPDHETVEEPKSFKVLRQLDKELDLDKFIRKVQSLTEEEKNFLDSPVIDVAEVLYNPLRSVGSEGDRIYQEEKYLLGFQYLYKAFGTVPDFVKIFYYDVEKLVKFAKEQSIDLFPVEIIETPGKASLYKVFAFEVKYPNVQRYGAISAAAQKKKPRIGLDLGVMIYDPTDTRTFGDLVDHAFIFDLEVKKTTRYVLEPYEKGLIPLGFWFHSKECLNFDTLQMMKNVIVDQDMIGTWYEKNGIKISIQSDEYDLSEFAKVIAGVIRIYHKPDKEPHPSFRDCDYHFYAPEQWIGGIFYRGALPIEYDLIEEDRLERQDDEY